MENRKPNTKCDLCGKDIYIRPNRLKTSKFKSCSIECSKKLRSEFSKGELNHQFGLKKELNSSYKNNLEKIKNGYKYIRDYEHPHNVEGWVREHRVVAEKYLLNNENSILINDKLYLKKRIRGTSQRF